MPLGNAISIPAEQQSALLEAALSAAPVGICLLDERGQLLFANQRYRSLWDSAPQTLADGDLYSIDPHSAGSGEPPAVAQASSKRLQLSDGRVLERVVQQISLQGQPRGTLVLWIDLTAERVVDTERSHQLELLHSLIDILPERIFFKDRTLAYTRVNQAFCDHYGLSEEDQIIGRRADQVLDDHSFNLATREEQQILESHNGISNDIRRETLKSGEQRWSRQTKLPLRDARGEVVGVYGFALDITEQKQSEELIWKQANFDHLTQLPNRRLLEDRWRSAWQAHLRDQRGIGFLQINLDGFKLINDSMGHQAGEQLLVSVAERLRRCTRGKDTVARLGADEFAIIATDIKEQGDLEVVIGKVRAQFEEPFNIDREAVTVSASIGVALAPGDGEEFKTIMMHADQALHEAKRAGGNGYKMFHAGLEETLSQQFSLANDLRFALKNREFSLNFQPIVDMQTGKTVKVETLVRWYQPQRGWVSPAEFIPVAESTGQIIALGQWIFEEAIVAIAGVRQETGRHLNLSVNVSPRQIQHESFSPDAWIAYVQECGLAPSDLVVEITEGLFLDPEASVLGHLDRFAELGVKISLDDFGTGYASISFLENFEIDVLKLDQAFVRDSERSPKRRILSQAIIDMAKALEFEVIAEGIETEDQCNWIRDSGCQYGQGYFFSKPLTVDKLIEHLHNESD